MPKTLRQPKKTIRGPDGQNVVPGSPEFNQYLTQGCVFYRNMLIINNIEPKTGKILVKVPGQQKV